jgi:hypothetical protein
MTLHRAALAFSLFTAITLPSYALAAEEPPVVTLLLKSLEQQTKVKATYNNVESGSDGSITVNGLAANVPIEGAESGALKISVESLKL